MGLFLANNSKYIFILFIAIAVTPWLLFLMMIYDVPFLYQSYIYIGIIVGYTFYITLTPYYMYKKHQGPTAGKAFTEGPIIYLNHITEDKLFGYDEVVEIDIDFSDRELKILEATRLYDRGRRSVLQRFSEIAKQKKEMQNIPQDVQDLIEFKFKITESDSIDEKVSKLLALASGTLPVLRETNESVEVAEENTEIENTETTKREDNESTFLENLKKELEKPVLRRPDEESAGIDIGKERRINEETGKVDEVNSFIVPEFLELKDLVEIKDINKLKELGTQFRNGKITQKELRRGIELLQEAAVKNTLKNYKFYRVRLYHEETIDGYEHITFGHAFLLLPDKIKKILATRTMEAFDYADYLVKVQCTKVMWACIGFVFGKIPILVCMYSDNMLKMQSDETIKAHLLKHSSQFYLRIKTMEWIINNLGAEQDPFIQEIEKLEVQNEGLRDKYDYLIQEYMADSFIKAPPDVQMAYDRLLHEKASYMKWKPVAVLCAIACGVMLFVLLFMFAGLTGGGSYSPPPKSCLTFPNLIKNLIFLKLIF